MVGQTTRIVGKHKRPSAACLPGLKIALACALLISTLLSHGIMLAGSATAATPREPQETRDPALADALLRDVTFVDAQQGWAVGDRGVIWHTADGGRHWELQTSGVDCPLTAVEFVDARHGWAAGGWTKPFSHATHGVWLETHDGGEHWRIDRSLMLPALRAIKFFDEQNGWAVARSSALFPIGVFTTQDGGRSW
ncbi:MAG TPA: YCF48-related protein, partial [Pirellulales bacterium]